MHRLPHLIAVLVVGLAAHQAFGAGPIQAKISSNEAVLGEILTVDVTLTNVDSSVVPELPTTEDFEIRANPGNPIGRSSNISYVNGRRSERVSSTYRYTVKPLKTGQLVLPPFSCVYKGRVSHSQQFPVLVEKDTGGALVFCEVEAKTETAYVGQSIDVRLNVWVRKFSQGGYEMSPEDAWKGFLSHDESEFSVFAEEVDRPSYLTSSRRDDDGNLNEYFVFILDASTRPTKPGRLAFDDLRIVYNYPVRLGRRTFNYVIERSRRIVVTAEVPDLEVKPIPEDGRPADFNGAVGQYQIQASAMPAEVPVGDPITLTLAIRGDGDLDRLCAPRLDQVEGLKRDFEIWGESLAGEIDGGVKRFSQTIRALREDVKEIPPIPMSYFDPQSGKFETAWSRAIPLKVKPAEKLALTELSDTTPTSRLLMPLQERTEGLLANYADPALLLRDRRATVGPWVYVLLAGLPLLYVIAWVGRNRVVRLRSDDAFRRRTQAYRMAKQALGGSNVSPGDARNALLRYIADRCNVPAGGMTRADAVQLLTERGVSADLIQKVDGLIDSLEQLEYGGAMGDKATVVLQAMSTVDVLEQCKLR